MSFDNPGHSSVQVLVKEEEEEKETQLLTAQTPCKEALMTLLPYSAVRESDADDGIIKVMDELQDFVSKMHKTWLKRRSTD